MVEQSCVSFVSAVVCVVDYCRQPGSTSAISRSRREGVCFFGRRDQEKDRIGGRELGFCGKGDRDTEKERRQEKEARSQADEKEREALAIVYYTSC